MTAVLNRRELIRTAGSAAALAAMGVSAQTPFPSRPIRIVVGLPAGGAADSLVRLMAEQLSKSLKQPVIIENRPGGLYQIAVQSVLAAPADGHTAIYINSSFVAVQAIHKRFDLLRDFQPLIKTNETPSVIVVSAESPYQTMQEMVEFGRAHPGILSYGTLGAGSYEHLNGVALEQAAKIQGLAVPYKGGPEMVNAVVGRNIHFTSINVVTAAPLIASGNLRPLAARHTGRIPAYPTVPTLQELGIMVPLPPFWGGYAMHALTPAPVAEKLRLEIETVFNEPAFAAEVANRGQLRSLSKNPAAFRDLIREEGLVLQSLAKQLNLSNR